MVEEEYKDSEEVYDDESREDMVQNDEISPEEEAFMAGYEEASSEEKPQKGEKAYEEAFNENKKKRTIDMGKKGRK